MKQNQKVHPSRRQQSTDKPMRVQFMLESGETITISHGGDHLTLVAESSADWRVGGVLLNSYPLHVSPVEY